jgi:pSer/pThr/pTyr-binding forkhead associated (FHA) protein
MTKLFNEISITIMSGSRDGEKINFAQPALGSERIITIGRRDTCDIHLDSDNQISRLHARLGCQSVEATASDTVTSPYILQFWLEDGGSRNGTFLEQYPKRISERASLRPGSLFRVGRTWLRLDVPLSFNQ